MSENPSGFFHALLEDLQSDVLWKNLSPQFSRLVNLKTWDKKTCKKLLNVLVEAIVSQPERSAVIAKKYPQLVLPVLSWALTNPKWDEKKVLILANVAGLNTDAKRFAKDKLLQTHGPFEETPSSGPPDPKKKCKNPLTTLESVHSLLKADPSFFASLWNWSQLIGKLTQGDSQCQWLASRCIQLALGMSEKDKIKIGTCFSETDMMENLLKYSELSKGLEFSNAYHPDLEAALELISECCPGVVCVSGVMLQTLLNNLKLDGEKTLVMVPSTKANLRSLAVAVTAGQSVLLQGPVGCGKTALVEHLAMMTGRRGPPDLMIVQLGEETDSKMLLGGYRCSEVPGEFVWRPGILTQAVEKGAWLILEDIDCASTDVISVLAALLETGKLAVPGYRDCVQAASTFQLFTTRRLTSSGGLQSTASILDKMWMQVNVEPLARHELETVIKQKYPALETVVSRLLDVFLVFSKGSHSMALESQPMTVVSGMDLAPEMKAANLAGRLISTRDLLKWCARASIDFKEGSPECALKILQDAIDIFSCAAPSHEERLRLASAAADRLGIVRTKADYFCKEYKPHIKSTPSKFIAGRGKVSCIQNVAAKIDVKSTYSLTHSASCLLERVACCIEQGEPVLLVGETGTGKTATIQLLAQKAGRKLQVVNMNQHSDSADLLGGYKPVDLKMAVAPVRLEFETLFSKTFDRVKNAKFLDHIASCFSGRRWDTLTTLMRHTLNSALKKPLSESDKESWKNLDFKLDRLESQLKSGQSSLAFSFVEGTLVKAVQEGGWVLLDEINLATAETLQCLSGLLEGNHGSLHLLERGDDKPVKRNPEFRLFACMNPATDVGKKDLPPGLRNRFTEFYVDELMKKSDLIQLTGCYLSGQGLSPSELGNLVNLYLKLKTEALKTLASGTGHKPHYSLRTLCRALSTAAKNPCGQVSRSLMESFSLSFLTQLDKISQEAVQKLIIQSILGKNASSVLKKPLPKPEGGDFINIEGFWVQQGRLEPKVPENYILTPCVRHHLRDLARAVSLDQAPVLLQGETSVGKTSLITYLASVTGHKCLRINNHEHTDLQEYLGQYSADSDGALTFKEGALVEAMRNGYWVILDELNLAPSDVLEALNRVLDDNRELFIPETQTLIKAHPRFMLFATQNPPGLYGGRKLLSRAFRNRFVELHFSEFPSSELETILQQRCELPASYAKKMVAVMNSLQLRRRESAAFAGKQGFMTLRDLFRWGERYRLAKVDNSGNHNWEQHLADEGYLVLAGRVRRQEETLIIEETLQKHFKCKMSPDRLFSLNSETSNTTKKILEDVINASVSGFEHIVWTFNMRRLAVLVGKAVQFKEPILLVGETGCGKTSVCQLLAALRGKVLFYVNCHMHTEAADFLGSLRPVRNHEDSDGKLFEWVDGPLVQSMVSADWFLADEISLADDSVLERLNSLLEPEQTLLLAEKGGDVVTAEMGFQFVATMNPGGDFGKKELSPALRNRLTEIWCEGCEARSDRIAVAEKSLRSGLNFGNQEDCTSGIGRCAADFIDWLQKTELGSRLTFSVRDLLTWIHFINTVAENNKLDQLTVMDVGSAYVHGACLTFLDSLGSGLTANASSSGIRKARLEAICFLEDQIITVMGAPLLYSPIQDKIGKVVMDAQKIGLEPFFIPKGPVDITDFPNEFLFDAPTTSSSVIRLLRALQLSKPVLLEGSPGVGKTNLIHALSKAAGYSLTRINLSDQTDASDLFGADLPVEGGVGGQFAWRDGPFLQALKAGDWIVLDELNLASQSVLEALNACLDHRGEVFIPEIGRSFKVNAKTTRIFACQNPQRQGGARRGLPKSFLNRFTEVYIEALTAADLHFIAQSLFPELPSELLKGMVSFTHRVSKETAELRLWGFSGGPWDMNLRDLSRWALAAKEGGQCSIGPGGAADLVYFRRMRNEEDFLRMMEVYEEEVGSKWPVPKGQPVVRVCEDHVTFGGVTLARGNCQGNESLLLLRSSYQTLHSLAVCVHQKWLSILVGKAGSGKSSAVSLLAALTGQPLKVLAMNSSMDTTEILGGFEQTDFGRHLDELAVRVETLAKRIVCQLLGEKSNLIAQRLLALWEHYLRTATANLEKRTVASETQLFHKRAKLLAQILKQLEAFSTKAAQIGEQVQAVDQRAQQAGALNAGGRFEWIDSLLVKCLRDGSWLLVENVNMCSAAVLDRLNALLEPGGCLTLGERGVNSEGVLHTVVPHPNFRLFFTMDPRNGEISRAMRNRGVEIYMRGPDEGSNLLPTLDLRALLTNCGISFDCEQRTLITIHKALGAAASALDPVLELSTLMQAAFLVHQNKLRGSSIKEALRFACLDVFVKPKSSADSKKQALLVLDEILDGAIFVETESDLVQPVVTQSLVLIQESSGLAQAKQDCELLSACLAAKEGESSFLNNLCDMNCSSSVSLQDLQIPLLQWIYKLSCPSDVRLRHALLQKCNVKCINELSAKIRDAILQNQNQSQRHFSTMDSNLQLCLWIDYLCSSMGELSISIKKGDRMSALQYSQAVNSKNVPANINNSPVLVKLSKLLTMVEKSLEAISQSKVELAVEQFEILRRGLSWRKHILDFATGTNLTRKSAPFIVQSLVTHFNWLKKHLLIPLTSLKEELPELKQLSRLVEDVRISIEVHPLKKLATIVLPKIGQPLPFRSENQLRAKTIIDEISALFYVWPANDKNIWCSLISWLETKEGSATKELLAITLKSLHLRNDIPDDELVKLQASAEALKKFKAVAKARGADSIIHDCHRLLLLNKLRSDLEVNNVTLEYLVDNLRRDSVSHPELLVLANLLAEGTENGSHKLKLETNILEWQLNHSSALNSPLQWLEWASNCETSPKTENQFEFDFSENNKTLAKIHPDSPILSLVTMFQVFNCGSKLEDAFEHQKNMQNLSALIWQATQSLHSDAFDLRLNELTSVTNSFNKILEALNPEAAEVDTFEEKVKLVSQVTNFAPLLQIFSEVAELLTESDVNWALVGKANVLLGFATLTLTSALAPVDPVQKKSLKLKYTLQDLTETEVCLYTNELLSRVRGETTKAHPEPRLRHPCVQLLIEHCENLKLKKEKLSSTTAARPEISHYPDIRKMVMQYCDTLASSSTALQIAEQLFLVGQGRAGDAELALNQEETWQLSQNKFCQDLKKVGAYYPDIVDPILASTYRIRFGMYFLRCGAIQRNEVLQNLLISTCSFPSISPVQPSLFSLVSECTKLAKMTASVMPKEKTKYLLHRLRMSSFEELKFQILAQGSFDSDSMQVFVSELSGLASAWKTQLEEKEKREREAQSLYKMKSTKEIEETELKKTFPMFHQEFEDVSMNVVYQKMDQDVTPMETEQELEDFGLITDDEMATIGQIHEQVFVSSTQRPWLQQTPTPSLVYSLEPLANRLETLNILLPSTLISMDNNLDKNLAGTFIVMLNFETDYANRPYDFYRDPLPSEVVKCQPLLNSIKKRVQELMQEWPEHPTLQTLETLCDRLLNFSSKSPLARYLCGVELVLSQLQTWEAHAHSGVSMGALSQAVSQLVLEWRRLELQKWSEALNNVQYKCEQRALSRWWCHLATLVGSVENETSCAVNDLISAIQQFMEQATLGDFQVRLRLLKAFHCQAACAQKSELHKNLQNIFWNGFTFYSQFSKPVENRLHSLRAPIEKKLKEAVKIARWTETNYWALRQKVERTHRTLFKHMREYQDILSQKASPAMNVPPLSLTEWNLELDTNRYLSNLRITSQEDELSAASWLKKALKLCRELFSNYRYPQSVKLVADFVLEVEETWRLVLSQGITPSKDADKEKVKSEQKNLLQRKRKAVADSFKSIQRLGISYRTGITHKYNFSLEYFLLDPLDISVNNKTEDDLTMSWKGCKEQISACVAKMTQLSAALTKPSSELGPNDLEKCQGYALHLMEMVVKDYGLLSKFTNDLNILSLNLEPLLEESVSPANKLNNAKDTVLNLLGSAAVWLSQFAIFLKTFPRSGGADSKQFMPEARVLSDGLINQAADLTERLLSNVEQIKSVMLQQKDHNNIIGTASITKLALCKPIFMEMSRNIARLKGVAPEYSWIAIDWLDQEFKRVSLLFDEIKAPADATTNLDSLLELTQKAGLLIIQRLYQAMKTRPELDEEVEMEEGFLVNFVKKPLEEDLENLKLAEFTNLVAEIGRQLAKQPKALENAKNIVPLIHQVQLLAKYLVVQLTGSLNASSRLLCQYLSLATMLVQKGFNMPPEMSDDKEGQGDSQPSDGMGLCDGEGEKDVSDRLESEDQLEGARQEGDPEEEPADKDIPEEENGVEVSDDFEGKLQDEAKNKEGGDDEDEGENEGDEDADKQMGETGEDTENLDKEVWGSDSEEEEGEMNETDKGKGEKDDVVPEVGAAEEGGPEGTQEKKDWDAQDQNEFPEDQIDSQHGKNEAPPEPEALDLPDDLKLDGDEEEGNNQEETEENPFETQELKDIKEQPEVEENEETVEEKPGDENQVDSDGSEDEEQLNFENPPGNEEAGGQDEEDKEENNQQEKEHGFDENEEESSPQEDEKEHEGQNNAENDKQKPEAAPSSKSLDSASQMDSTFEQKDSNWGGEADEDKGQEGLAEQDEGHASASQKESKMAAPAQKQEGRQEPRERKKPGKTDDSHTLGDTKEPVQKKLRLADDMAKETGPEEDQEDEEAMQQDGDADLHQHVKEAKSSTAQTMDAATQEQAKEQKPFVSEDGDKPEDDEEMDVVEEEDEKQEQAQKELKSEKIGDKDKSEKGQDGQRSKGEGSKENVEVEGEIVGTDTVPRGGVCSAHTQLLDNSAVPELSPEEVQALREQLEQQLASWSAPPAGIEALQTWTQFLAATSALARDLCEQLRLVLEPTQAARLMGDYRTGRRINMRKVIPYIASEFRKDKIWLRRTKPSRRKYQIVLALDDSSSMAENHSKELAFESLALVSQALTLLEAGELAVVSFGEEPKILHQLESTFNEESGARLLQQLSFGQRQTRVGRMVNFVTSMLSMASRQASSGSELAQLLLIVSDGRGIFSEGREVVEQAVRAAKEANVFIIFLAIEDPHSKDSILDIRMPVFHNGKLQMISSYLENFPFPYYLILRDIESLPTVLSDALRQWFELVAADVKK
ncbi:midasin [Neocloeon triangulifer]|uniref:midasin n=1 Tax=Neocloeon triangulifer TaxID=2078957 RepID=UPI00286ED974|nr:midasin [Neocloeon triangulifer]